MYMQEFREADLQADAEVQACYKTAGVSNVQLRTL